MELYSLGIILKEINNFSMDKFENRLILQKTIYLLQSFGVDLGYPFQWYLHGMYCSDLTKQGFELEGVMGDIPPIEVKFQDDATQSRYNVFLEFMKDKKNNSDMLEIASSISYFYKRRFNKKKILQLVENKKARFTAKDCKYAWDELEKYSVIRS